MPGEIEIALYQTGRAATRRSTYRLFRRVVGRLKRWSRWEFWPPYLSYIPVIGYIGWLAVRFRSFTLFTAANPAIPASGFIGESKIDILKGLGGAGIFLPHSTLLKPGTAGDRFQDAQRFMCEHTLTFPIVIKPDAGQRGSGVCIARSAAQLRSYLESSPSAVILQEYVAGEEFGVFYVRRPGENQGRIFSVTEKRMPVVIGDGQRTLEELILADERALCMADFYTRANSTRISDVLRPGEMIQLVELGSHCRGAIFLDGSSAITSILEETVDQIASRFEGFFFGRFDIRVPSREDLMAGRNLKVIELNGVTSEATHIYDPELSLFDAYRTLFQQWKIAFEIGLANQRRGAQVSSIWDLWGMVREFHRKAETRLG